MTVRRLVAFHEFVEVGWYASSRKLSRQKLYARCGVITPFEIVVGLFNLISLICGIVLLLNRSVLREQDCEQYS